MVREQVTISTAVGIFSGEPRRNVAGLFPHPHPAERTLRTLLADATELATISVVAQYRSRADERRERAAATEGLLTLALDGALGRRIGAGVLAIGYPQAVVIVGALATRLPGLARGTPDSLGALLVAGGLPQSALVAYLAAIRTGQPLIMVGAASPERERRLRHLFARHGAIALRSFPAPSPGRHPVVSLGPSAPSCAVSEPERVASPQVTALPEAPEAWVG